MRLFLPSVMTLGAWLVFYPASAQAPAPTAELDAFMAQVLARRDENWKKVQQYILDEEERVEFRGPGEILLWGAKREYLWYPRDGFFVRSPVRFNGVTACSPMPARPTTRDSASSIGNWRREWVPASGRPLRCSASASRLRGALDRACAFTSVLG